MYYKKSPKYLFILYTVNFEYGDFRPRIKNSIPFVSKEEAEAYMDSFVNNIDDNESVLFAIIPAE